MPFDALRMQRICSAALLAVFATAEPFGGCVKIVQGFDSRRLSFWRAAIAAGNLAISNASVVASTGWRHFYASGIYKSNASFNTARFLRDMLGHKATILVRSSSIEALVQTYVQTSDDD
jgi:hypothetical protein